MTAATAAGFWTQEAATVRNTIVAGNSLGPAAGNDGPDCDTNDVIGSQGHNLVRDPTDCDGLTGPGDITGQDPNLGPLADNGGPTPTHALLAGSPAIDKGDPAPPGLRRDLLRGHRPAGRPRNCDIGAYELVVCLDAVVNRVGTAGDDILTGTEQADGFLGQGGDDTVNALGGDDVACLGRRQRHAPTRGPGNDVVQR